VNVWLYAAPVLVNVSGEGDATGFDGVGVAVGIGVGLGVGDGVGVGEGVGVGPGVTTVAVPPEPLHPKNAQPVAAAPIRTKARTKVAGLKRNAMGDLLSTEVARGPSTLAAR
jgi:hypothetical protein